ncbi:MAG: hypothetical protein HY423_01525 [Candidatus Lambdaproteobacteria bacterium]|nr:hypothetical protein [Candidatus Lambdaproteobacteria bacterium]
MEQWEGTVQTISQKKFVAVLRSMLSAERTEESATFEIDSVPDADLSLVQPGAVFYWSVGYRNELSGQKVLMSVVRFRRLPAWSKRDIERARNTAEKFSVFFDDQHSESASG